MKKLETIADACDRDSMNKLLDFLESLHEKPGVCPGGNRAHCIHELCSIFRLERRLLLKKVA